jgi:hypothetical protein
MPDAIFKCTKVWSFTKNKANLNGTKIHLTRESFYVPDRDLGERPHNTYAIFRDFWPSPPPFVTQNRTNPYMFTVDRNKSLTPPSKCVRIMWTFPWSSMVEIVGAHEYMKSWEFCANGPENAFSRQILKWPFVQLDNNNFHHARPGSPSGT